MFFIVLKPDLALETDKNGKYINVWSKALPRSLGNGVNLIKTGVISFDTLTPTIAVIVLMAANNADVLLPSLFKRGEGGEFPCQNHTKLTPLPFGRENEGLNLIKSKYLY